MTLSYWQERSFESEHEADVVVVGAGFTGAAVAWWLTRIGLGVTVVERAIPASGASGAGLGVIASLDGVTPEPVRERARRGREDLAAKVWTGREHRIGLLWDPPGWPGGVAVDPVRLVELLLEDAATAGAQIDLHQEVSAVQCVGREVEVRAARAQYRAERGVLCVGRATPTFFPGQTEGLVLDRQRFGILPAEAVGAVGTPGRRLEDGRVIVALDPAPAPAASPGLAGEWERSRLVRPDGMPCWLPRPPGVVGLVGLREERWDLGFDAARRLADWLVEGEGRR